MAYYGMSKMLKTTNNEPRNDIKKVTSTYLATIVKIGAMKELIYFLDGS